MTSFGGLKISDNETAALSNFFGICMETRFGYSFSPTRTSIKYLLLMVR